MMLDLQQAIVTNYTSSLTGLSLPAVRIRQFQPWNGYCMITVISS
jgi:hypothetical protein